MEIQRGNCASIFGTVESPKLLEELFELFELFDTKSDHLSQLRLFNHLKSSFSEKATKKFVAFSEKLNFRL